MSDKKKERMLKIKLELAAKYDRLASITKSQPQRKRMQHHADRFRRQAKQYS